MRTKSDVHGPQPSETPACRHCGLPLFADARICPYCERRVREGVVSRLFGRGRRPAAEATIAGVPERALLVATTAILAAVAVIGVVIAALI